MLLPTRVLQGFISRFPCQTSPLQEKGFPHQTFRPTWKERGRNDYTPESTCLPKLREQDRSVPRKGQDARLSPLWASVERGKTREARHFSNPRHGCSVLSSKEELGNKMGAVPRARPLPCAVLSCVIASRSTGEPAAMKRAVRIEFDCDACGAKAIFTDRRDTDASDEDLLKIIAKRTVCPNPNCPTVGRPQQLKPARIVPE